MIFARNSYPVADGYGDPATFLPEQPVEKLRLIVTLNDVILQPSEDDVNQPPMFENPTDTEILCPKGFHVFVPAYLWFGIRFRNAVAGSAGIITFVGYG